MKKKYTFLVVILLTTIALTSTIFYITKPHYQKYIITDDKWESIKKNKIANNQLKIEKIEFNNYQLIIDNANNIVYYSIVKSFNQYNPTIKYKANSKNTKIAFSGKMNKSDEIEGTKIYIYDDKEFHIYKLSILNLPYMNIKGYNDSSNKAEITIFDNSKKAIKRIIKSSATLSYIENDRYLISLRKKSLGQNGRKNELSLFGEEKIHEFLMHQYSGNYSQFEEDESNLKVVALFINNKFQGKYVIQRI